jgi:hypothetical protein
LSAIAAAAPRENNYSEPSLSLKVKNAGLLPAQRAEVPAGPRPAAFPNLKKLKKKVDRIKNRPYSAPSEQPDSKQLISRSVKQGRVGKYGRL